MIYVNSISVSPRSITLKKGTWYYGISAEVCPLNADCRSVTWSSSNTSVATVNASNGYIYAKAAGTANITATAIDGSGCRDSITVTVSSTVSVQSVSLNRTSITLEEGDCTTLSATVLPTNATNRAVTWSSNRTNVATVNGGNVFAVKKGTANITATAADGSGKSASCTVTVTDDTLVKSITVHPSNKEMVTGKSAFFSATVCPVNATDRCVIWSSSCPDIATVNPISGLVYAKRKGSATIIAEARDGSGVCGCCALTVTDPICVEDITLNRSSMTLYKGNSYLLSATVCPGNATNKTVRWCSSRTSVATVNTYTGRVTAKSAGITTVYAIAQDGSGVSACCTVHVRQTVLCCAEETPKNKRNRTPVDVYSGAHVLQNTLISLFGGQNLGLIAHYNSTNLACGDLGSGWYHNFEKHLEVYGSVIYVYSSPSIYALYRTKSNCHNVYTCASPNRNGYVLTVDYACPYPYKLNCNSAATEYYDCDGNLARIVNHEGFETTVTHSGNLITITDTVSGKKIYMEKDASCRIVRIYDDSSRQVTLTYTNGLLTKICDVNGNSLRYTYDADGRILSGTDAENICYFENTYDEYGRIVEQKDAIAGSAKTKFSYADNMRTVTDRNGKQSVSEFDDNGLLVRYTDPNGNSKCYCYDERYNIICETDAKGHSVCKTYNAFNKPTTITDKNGNKTTIIYDSKGNVLKIRYPAIGNLVPQETYTYNSRNQPLTYTDRRGTVTQFTYDANGLPATKKIGSRNAIQYSYQNGLLKSQTDARGNTTTYTHNALGQVITRTDANQKSTSYEYDNCGNLLKTTDANGKSIVTTYDGNYQKTSVTDANGNKTEYSYNGNMKNTEITLPDGNTVQYQYDGEDRPVKMIDQENEITTVQYDAGGRVKSKQFPDGGVIQYTYDAVGNVTKETNQKGAVVTRTYDPNGNVLTVKDHAGNITSYTYNAMSKVTKVTNAASGVTTYEYSAAGDLLTETDALGNETVYTYDAYGNRLTATDPKGNVTTYTYDANNNLLTVKNALNQTTTYTYNSLNQCVSVKDAMNHTVRFGYDALGRRTTVTDANNHVFTTSYDANGNVIQVTDAKGNTVRQTAYNCMNLPVSVTDAAGKITTYTYTAAGKVASITDPLNHKSEYTYTYGDDGRSVSVKDAANHVSTAKYDQLGNVIELVGPLGGDTDYTYDLMGRLTSESTPSGGTVAYSYNSLNLQSQLTNARNQTHTFAYDAKGRITSRTSVEGITTYTYDANGNVLTVSHPSGTITRTYDALNRVTACTEGGKTIGYEYDAAGNLKKLIYPDSKAVSYQYDGNRNLIRVTDWSNRITSYTYDENNRVTGVTKPDGSVTTTEYDDQQRVTSTVEKTASGAVITGFEYTYDNLSRIVEEKVLANSTKMCYNYDSLNRVTKRTVKNLSNVVLSEESFGYDAAGNITSAPTGSFAYDTDNRLTAFNGNTVSYDMDGNLLSNGAMTCTYDSANRLLTSGGHTYTYNAEGVRIRNLCAGEDAAYTYNTNSKLSQLLMKTVGTAVTKYVYGFGLIGEETNNAFKTYHFDSRGSTIAITDENGNITDTFAYDTYGKMTSRTGTTPVIFGYNGRYGVVTDANGLLYMRARYYSPAMRRFVNADVIPGNISKAVTLNRYAFADANPVLLMDPTGFSPWSWFKSHVIDPVGDAIVEGYNTAKDWVVDTATEIGNTVVNAYNTAKDWVVDTATDIGDAVVNTYQTAKNTIVDTANKVGNAVEDGFHSATTWIDENVIQPVGDFFENTARQIKDGTKKVMSKVTDSFINSIEAKVYFGTGIGVSVENGGADINKSIVIGLDDGKEYAGHEFNVEVGIGIIGYSSNHLHLSEKDYSPVRCDSDHVYDRKTIANILSCPETIHTDSISVGPVSITQNGDVSVSLDGSIFAVIGGGFSVGINLTEFFGGIFG